MGATNHQTTTPEQMRTDTYEVLEPAGPDALRIIGTVEVPQYSQPTADGTELSESKRTSLAVRRAVDRPVPDGTLFGVRKHGTESTSYVEYESNPSHTAVWDSRSKDSES